MNNIQNAYLKIKHYFKRLPKWLHLLLLGNLLCAMVILFCYTCKMISFFMPTPITDGPWNNGIGQLTDCVYYDTPWLIGITLLNILALLYLLSQVKNYNNLSLANRLFGIFFIIIALTCGINSVLWLSKPEPYIAVGEEGIFINPQKILWQNIKDISYQKHQSTRRGSRETIKLELNNGTIITITDNFYPLTQSLFGASISMILKWQHNRCK